MITALTPGGRWVSARAASASPEAAYRCPWCGGELFFKRGVEVAAHFAHYANTACEESVAAAAGESPAHRALKDSVASVLADLGIGFRFERGVWIDEGTRRRPDILTDRFVVECQASHLETGEFARRTRDHARNGMPVLWVWSAALALRPGVLPSPDDRPAFQVPASVRHTLRAQGDRLYVLDATIDPLAEDPDRFRAVGLAPLPGGDRWHFLATFAHPPWEIGERTSSPGIRLVDLGDGLWVGPSLPPPKPRREQPALAETATPAEARRAWMDDAGNPSACTGCGGEALRNGTRLCAPCWASWQAERVG